VFLNEKREVSAGSPTAQKTEARASQRAAQKGGLAGCGKRQAAEKGSLPAYPCPQPSLGAARLNV